MHTKVHKEGNMNINVNGRQDLIWYETAVRSTELQEYIRHDTIRIYRYNGINGLCRYVYDTHGEEALNKIHG